MSRLFPHTPYAEDQPLPHTILTTHVLTRGLQAGSLVGTGIGTILYTFRQFKILAPKIPASTFTATVLKSSGVGAVVGVGLMCVALPGRMWGREEIEWKDRSWRLLENKGQLECDDWTYGGMVGGAVVAAVRRNLGWRGAVGMVGAGSLVGMMGYMGWRHGVKGGKWEEDSM